MHPEKVNISPRPIHTALRVRIRSELVFCGTRRDTSRSLRRERSLNARQWDTEQQGQRYVCALAMVTVGQKAAVIKDWYAHPQFSDLLCSPTG